MGEKKKRKIIRITNWWKVFDHTLTNILFYFFGSHKQIIWTVILILIKVPFVLGAFIWENTFYGLSRRNNNFRLL